ncbi:hypothetical protein LTS18_011343, partial [Coniosporium uncinatum]
QWTTSPSTPDPGLGSSADQSLRLSPGTTLSPWASDAPTYGELTKNGQKLTCWEILTVWLGKFVREQQEKGILLTDESMQLQARIILYDSDDPWNQTAADNPEWLDIFKRAHGLVPSKPVSRGWVLEDLGVDVGEMDFEDLVFDQEKWDKDVGESLEAGLREIAEMPCSGFVGAEGGGHGEFCGLSF